jgi:ribosomal protein S12 methylthiotransferase
LYAYPEGIDDALITVMATHPQICRYLDMPIQHADNGILKKMGRLGTMEGTRKLIGRLRSQLPGIALRTSVIVGFPGETDFQFEQLTQFIKEMEFDRLGVFTYSQEVGTPAAEMAGQIEPNVKKDRQKKIRQCQATISKRKHQRMIGQVLEVLVTDPQGGRSFRDAPEIDGRISFSHTLPVGSFASVQLCRAFTHDCEGALLESG